MPTGWVLQTGALTEASGPAGLCAQLLWSGLGLSDGGKTMVAAALSSSPSHPLRPTRAGPGDGVGGTAPVDISHPSKLHPGTLFTEQIATGLVCALGVGNRERNRSQDSNLQGYTGSSPRPVVKQFHGAETPVAMRPHRELALCPKPRSHDPWGSAETLTARS